MLPKPHISVSQINTYIRCPVQYYYRYIEGLIIPPSAAITRGKSVHAGNELNYRQKMETHEDLPLSEVQEYVSATFDEQAKETDFQGEDKGKVKDATISLATLYHEEVAPAVQPKAVEEQVEVAFEGEDYTLLGYIDLIDQNGVIRDTKTAGRTPNESVLQDNLQLAGYSMMYRTLTGEEEKGVALDYLVANKTPKHVQLKAQVDDAQRTRFLRTMDAVVKAIKAEVYYPNPNNTLCSPKHCGYWEVCHKEW